MKPSSKEMSMELSQNKLFNRDFLLLIIVGQLISMFGNAILRFALPLYILKMTGSAALFGMVSALSFIPMVIISPIGGIVSDRANKKWIIVMLDFITTVLILLYVFFSGLVAIVPFTVFMLMILYAIQGMYTPVVQSSVPLLVPTDKLIPANTIVNLVSALSRMIGPVVGGILYAKFGLVPILYVSGICFALAAFIEIFIRIPHIKHQLTDSILRIVKRDISESLQFITKKNPIIFKLIIITFLFEVFLSSMVLIGLPILITQHLGMDSSMYGIAQGVFMAGGLMGGVLASLFGKKISVRKAHWFLLTCSLSIVPIGLVFFLNTSSFVSYLVITIMIPITMGSGTWFSVISMAFLQSQTPIEIMGKVMSFITAMIICAQPIGQLLFGILFGQFSDSPWIVISISAILSIVVSVYSLKQFKKIGEINKY